MSSSRSNAASSTRSTGQLRPSLSGAASAGVPLVAFLCGDEGEQEPARLRPRNARRSKRRSVRPVDVLDHEHQGRQLGEPVEEQQELFDLTAGARRIGAFRQWRSDGWSQAGQRPSPDRPRPVPASSSTRASESSSGSVRRASMISPPPRAARSSPVDTRSTAPAPASGDLSDEARAAARTPGSPATRKGARNAAASNLVQRCGYPARVRPDPTKNLGLETLSSIHHVLRRRYEEPCLPGADVLEPPYAEGHVMASGPPQRPRRGELGVLYRVTSNIQLLNQLRAPRRWSRSSAPRSDRSGSLAGGLAWFCSRTDLPVV